MPAYARGTQACTLRVKCTRQRCQAAWSTWAMAALRPSWASEITSFTPASPRAMRERKNSTQNSFASEGAKPET